MSNFYARQSALGLMFAEFRGGRGAGSAPSKYAPGPVVLMSVPCERRFRLAILNGIPWNLQEIITTTNRWTDYILGEIGRGTREQDTTEHSNRRQTVKLSRLLHFIAALDSCTQLRSVSKIPNSVMMIVHFTASGADLGGGRAGSAPPPFIGAALSTSTMQPFTCWASVFINHV